jgi:hypothetical protein
MKKMYMKTICIVRLYRPLLVVVLAIFGVVACSKNQAQADILMYKNPQCGCCDKWATHLRDAGFSVEIQEYISMSGIKEKYGIKPALQSCHTAIHAETGLVFEGHVPANHVSALIENAPEGSIGLSVPGMPIGSPGMEVDDRKDQYDVLLLKSDGSVVVYATENAR